MLPNTRIIEPSHAWHDLGLRNAWRHRELLRVLIWRNITVRYRQMALGMLWIAQQVLSRLRSESVPDRPLPINFSGARSARPA